MDVPWQNLFPETEMEQYGDLLNYDSLDSEEMVLEEILKQFKLSSENESCRPQTQFNSATPCLDESCGHGAAEMATNQKPSKSVNQIMAERKRRRDLSQRFIELSAIIPGLDKIDRVSIVKEAVNYVKHLENRVKELEEHDHRLSKINSYTDKGTNSGGVAVPEVEARVLDNDVLIRIHCEKNKGFLIKILSHITSIGFSDVRTSVLPLGNCALYITIIAQIGEKCKVNVKELVKSLRQVLLDSPVPQQ